MKYLLDTNVISELIARKRNQEIVDWVNNLDQHSVYLSVITVGEIRKGIEKLIDSQRAALLTAWLKDDLLLRFDNHILSLGVEEMLEWGRMVGQSERRGRPLSTMDSLIAALAIYYGCTLVTRNENDFTGLGIRIINPWDEITSSRSTL